MTALKPHTVSAYNLAKNSENKMHDDLVARAVRVSGRFGPWCRCVRLYEPYAGGEMGEGFS